MSKKSPPKTAFYKVTAELDWTDQGQVAASQSIVVEAASRAEALDFAAAQWVSIEEYPVDKLVAYIKAGGEPVKVPPKPKRPYAKKAATKHAQHPAPASPPPPESFQEPAPVDSITTN